MAVAENPAEHALVLGGKQNQEARNLDDLLRRFLSRVLKVQPGFSWLLIVKRERRERN